MSADSRRLAAVRGHNVFVADVKEHQEVAELETGVELANVAIASKNTWVAAGSARDGVRVWDFATRSILHKFNYLDQRATVAFSPQDDLLAINSPGKFVVVETSTWRERFSIPRKGLAGLAPLPIFSRDGSSCVASLNHYNLELLDTATGQQLAIFPSPEKYRLASYTFARGDSQLVAGSDRWQTQIWDLSQLRGKLRPLGLDWGPASEVPRSAQRPLNFVAQNAVAPAIRRTSLLFKDDFELAIKPDWKVINSLPEKISLTNRPGHLTLLSQAGGFFSKANDFRNLFLLPVNEPGSFEATIKFTDLEPAQGSQQAALLLLDDPDNYIKFYAAWNHLGRYEHVSAMKETGALPVAVGTFLRTKPRGSLWLRLTKIGTACYLSASEDGILYTTRFEVPWTSPKLPHIGFIAKNGSGITVPELPVHVDFFELWAVEPEKF